MKRPDQKTDQTDIRSYWRVTTPTNFFPIAYRLTNRKESSGRLIKRHKFNIGGQITNAKLAEQARFSSRALDLLIREEGDSGSVAAPRNWPKSLSGEAFRRSTGDLPGPWTTAGEHAGPSCFRVVRFPVFFRIFNCDRSVKDINHARRRDYS
ncbi:hypothetical protein [Burkholderia plantarii]|uniref:Uncharacterized protein n=1 Tax=Burkholderia plantarii TaxID=41899 RepID=A0A0B6S4J4_BURPL|nr:hypothetical protein [Burkholderia plantarii]AJK50598.1 hypothetical protein BGL_2c25420 [Burkholderia plantarii]